MVLHDILSPSSARTLKKALHSSVPLHDFEPLPLLLGGLCEELEALAGQHNNILEALFFEVRVEIAMRQRIP